MAKKPTPPTTDKRATPPGAASKGEVNAEPSSASPTKSEASPGGSPPSSPKGSRGRVLPSGGLAAGPKQVSAPEPAAPELPSTGTTATPVSSVQTTEAPSQSGSAKAGSKESEPGGAQGSAAGGSGMPPPRKGVVGSKPEPRKAPVSQAGAEDRSGETKPEARPPQQGPSDRDVKPSAVTTESGPEVGAADLSLGAKGTPRPTPARLEPSRPAGEPIETPTAATAPPLPETSVERAAESVYRPSQELQVELEPQSEMLPEPGPESEATPFYESRDSLFIVHVTPEMAPVAKVGGLADVVFGLSRELAIRGNHVEIILPKYDNLRYDHIFQMHVVYEDLWVPWYEGTIHCTVYFSFVHDRKCFFIEPHSQDNFFNRGSLYGFRDDVLRFAFFSRAAMEFMWKAGKQPDIIHCHDWQTALVPVFLYEIYQPLGMHHPRVCLTIHNFKHQGVTGVDLLHATGLHRPERFMAYERLGDNHHRGAVNLLKGGIVYSNFVATVSPRYAYETKDQGQGFGLEPTLHTHHMKYGGVVNGVDYDVWNPEIDHHIPVPYNVDTIDGKYDDKRALRHRLMLADNEKPIVAFIGRLDPQKGLELVRHAIFYALGKGAQFVLLGSSPDHGINADFWGLKQMLNENQDCHLEIGFDEDLSHLIYAGADMILVPSQFEPCGLTQLIALRYGTIPVVRSVGGLADTVFDKDHSFRPLHERNGYSFETYDNQGLESALGRAIDCYYEFPDHFRELMKNAMRSDNSWNHPGQDYLNIYDFIRHR